MKITTVSKMLFLAALTTAVALPVASTAQEFRFDPGHFRFEHDDQRANEGKRASCEVYAQIAVVQAEANRRFNCGFSGPRWLTDAHDHFRWCRFVRRDDLIHETRDRGMDLQSCFNRMGDFDDERR